MQYRNPSVGVAVVLIKEVKLFICRRSSGGWCIPCGHVEYDENVERAAVREMAEETGLLVSLQDVLAIKSNFHNLEHQTVGIWYHGHQISDSPRPGSDLVDLAFTEMGSLSDLVFPTDLEVVEELPRGNRES
ncbi:MAG: NUDIX hydrolase [Pirellulales bacterium]